MWGLSGRVIRNALLRAGYPADVLRAIRIIVFCILFGRVIHLDDRFTEIGQSEAGPFSRMMPASFTGSI